MCRLMSPDLHSQTKIECPTFLHRVQLNSHNYHSGPCSLFTGPKWGPTQGFMDGGLFVTPQSNAAPEETARWPSVCLANAVTSVRLPNRARQHVFSSCTQLRPETLKRHKPEHPKLRAVRWEGDDSAACAQNVTCGAVKASHHHTIHPQRSQIIYSSTLSPIRYSTPSHVCVCVCVSHKPSHMFFFCLKKKAPSRFISKSTS